MGTYIQDGIRNRNAMGYPYHPLEYQEEALDQIYQTDRHGRYSSLEEMA